MSMEIEVTKISQLRGENIEYESMVFVIKIDKKINFESTKEFFVLLKTLIDGGALKIIINLDKLEAIDSSGIGGLINYTKQIRKKKGEIVLCNVSPEITKIFDVINLRNFIEIFKNDVDALNHYRYV